MLHRCAFARRLDTPAHVRPQLLVVLCGYILYKEMPLGGICGGSGGRVGDEKGYEKEEGAGHEKQSLMTGGKVPSAADIQAERRGAVGGVQSAPSPEGGGHRRLSYTDEIDDEDLDDGGEI